MKEGKVKPSLTLHEVHRKYPGARFGAVVFCGSRTACNRWWLALPETEREFHTVQDTRQR